MPTKQPAKQPASPPTPRNFLRRGTGSGGSPYATPQSRSGTFSASPQPPGDPQRGDSPPDHRWERLYRGVPPVPLADPVGPQPQPQPKEVSKPRDDEPAEDIPFKEDPKCEPEPLVEAFQSIEILELPVEAPKDKPQLLVEAFQSMEILELPVDAPKDEPKKASKPEVKDLVVDSPSKVILKKVERKPTVKAPMESSQSKQTPKSKVKAAVQRIEDKVLDSSSN